MLSNKENTGEKKGVYKVNNKERTLTIPLSHTRKELLDKHRGKKKPRTSLSESVASETSFIDVEVVVSPKIVRKLKKDKGPNLEKCPCKKSDTKSWLLKCTKCQQHWHSGCSNLHGISQDLVESLENWLCPACFIPCTGMKSLPSNNDYICTVCRNNSNISSALHTDSAKQFIENVTSLTQLNEELSNSASHIDYFNLHLKHLLLDKSSIDNYATKLDETTNNIGLISDSITKLSNGLSELKSTTVSPKSNDDAILEKLSDLGKHLDSLSTDNTNFKNDVKNILQDLKTTSSFSQSNESNKSPIKVSPNTESPHYGPAKPVCEPYISYERDVVDEELKGKLFEFVQENESNFKSVGGNRDCIYYGEYGYYYTGGKHEASRIPDIIHDLLKCVRPQLSDPSGLINSCLINRYKSGTDVIPPHRDNELFIDPDSEIITVSIGAKRTMVFSYNSATTKKELDLEDCSILISTRHAQDFWEHEIESDESITDIRYSFTFRHIAPFFMNSTIIVGDSNTRFLKFGVDQGTFGKWMPGKRVEALHIEEIPDPVQIGPYRNIVLHTGINNIKNQSRRSNKSLVNDIEIKCNRIHGTYPKARIFISMLLPTKLRSLNYHVNAFNNLILDMAYKYKYVNVIDNAGLGGDDGCLREEFGRWDKNENCPLSIDFLHLGKSGLRILGSKIKVTVVKSKNNRFKKRPIAAAQRDHHDGYQST